MDKAILPECYTDTLLAEILVPTKRGYNHKHGCLEVQREMRDGSLKDKFALGIIDRDKRQIAYLNDFTILDRHQETLFLWKHRDKPHYIIQICPAIEQWILTVCLDTGIDIGMFGLPRDVAGLKNITKPRTSLRHKGLSDLFDAIKLKREHIEVRKLMGWIRLLRDDIYGVDGEALKIA